MSKHSQTNDHGDVIIDMESLEKAQKNAKNEQSTKRLKEAQSIQTNNDRSRIIWIILKITSLAVIGIIVYKNYCFNQTIDQQSINETERSLKCVKLGPDGRMLFIHLIELHEQARKCQRDHGYTLVKNIGKGARGAIFEVNWNGSIAALKVEKITSHVAREKGSKEFERQKIANCMDPSVVPNVYDVWTVVPNVYDVWTEKGQDGSYIFTIMELVKGQDCQTRSEAKEMKKEEIVNLILDGIAFFSEYNGKSNAHFDIKPANIMIRDKDKKARFIDFGHSHTQYEFDANPSEIGTRYFQSGITQYAKKWRDKIKELKYPWAVHDFIPFLNTILYIVNFQYGLGFDRCNWLRWFQDNPVKKDEFWTNGQVRMKIAVFLHRY